MIVFERDGSVTLRGDADPTRTQTIAAGTPRADLEVALAAFAALEPPEPLPAEIPMHKARKALRIMGWWEPLMTLIAADPDRLRAGCVMDELDTAPNMVLEGATTLRLLAALGHTAAERDELARLALTLP